LQPDEPVELIEGQILRKMSLQRMPYQLFMTMNLFTIGHSNHSIEEFIALLQQHEITALADIRSHPYSRYLPHFNQEFLKKALKEAGIAYVFLGQELGARPKNQNCYINGKAVYDRIAAMPEFITGIERICQGVERYQIALMCAEQDPITCHRAILVCRHLQERVLEIQHILKNGELESHDCLEDRLLKLHHLIQDSDSGNTAVQLNLFDASVSNNNLGQIDKDLEIISRAELVVKAYQLQSEKIAYLDKNLANQGDEPID
jgi:uncharacterized protein (DUF488 family)